MDDRRSDWEDAKRKGLLSSGNVKDERVGKANMKEEVRRVKIISVILNLMVHQKLLNWNRCKLYKNLMVFDELSNDNEIWMTINP
jgi:hypothetical protein